MLFNIINKSLIFIYISLISFSRLRYIKFKSFKIAYNIVLFQLIKL
jgi:hypothetical protein